MTDLSALDSKYFVDSTTYNCPFCKRRNVVYWLESSFKFDWTDTKRCFGYLVRCSSCHNISLHLSFTEIPRNDTSYGSPVRQFDANVDLDNAFFFDVPRTFFVLDQRIPHLLRELLDEAEGCWKGNFLTGASVCIRKAIYELAVLHKAQGDHYDERVRSLKAILPHVAPNYFDTLLAIQKTTSDKVHEESYDGWTAGHVRLLLTALYEILHEIYVVPADRAKRLDEVHKLSNVMLGDRVLPRE